MVPLTASGMGAVALMLADLLPINHFVRPAPPVLMDTVWMTIHVPVIMVSYSVLSLGVLIAHVQLVVMAAAPGRRAWIRTIDYMHYWYIHVGSLLLLVGIVTGSMWAASSWGRYWGWDPKETWALITVLVYAFVTHMHRIPGLRGRFAFNLASFISYSSVMMTYFGVNYFLGGMHSYASGSSFKVPLWSYLLILVLIALSIFAFRKQQKMLPEKSNMEDS
jgi:ABC-type transport system involved in cytochrome c biogenesis permease subunit